MWGLLGWTVLTVVAGTVWFLAVTGAMYLIGGC